MDRLARFRAGGDLASVLGEADDDGVPELEAALAGLLGDSAELAAEVRLKQGIHRLQYAGGALASVVVKRLDPFVAHRSRMLEERWLPATGLSAAGPGLLATVISRAGTHAWQVFDDLGDHGLDRNSDDTAAVGAAVAAIARIHRRFAEHPILAEVRLWGGDLGTPWYAANVRDALRSVEALASKQRELPERTRSACERLVERLRRFRAEEHERAELWHEIDGCETLLHGDLWTKNVFTFPAAQPAGPIRVRLIDWDHAAVGAVAYDLSTFLMRFALVRRRELLASYEEALERDGFRPTIAEWNRLFDTAEIARIANRVIWPALALLRKDTKLREWSLEQLVEVDSWFEALGPVIATAAEVDA